MTLVTRLVLAGPPRHRWRVQERSLAIIHLSEWVTALTVALEV